VAVLDQRAARLDLATAVGSDLVLTVAVSEGGVDYDPTGATVTAVIYDLAGTDTGYDLASSWGGNDLTLSASDAVTTALGAGIYSYAVVITKATVTTAWLAGRLTIDPPTSPHGTSATSATLSLTGGSTISLTVASGGLFGGNLDGGSPSSIYGGTTGIDGGSA
jgi:hypothetical protein